MRPRPEAYPGRGCRPRGSGRTASLPAVTGTATVASKTPAAKLDAACAAAVDLARDAVEGDHIGEHLGVVAEGERDATHYFECTLPGYKGWRWAVTVARAPRSRTVTVSETVPLPGDGALLAPSWVPWHERLQPGDLGVGDEIGRASCRERV